MMNENELNGWNFIIHRLITTKFPYKEFILKDIYVFWDEFKKEYPNNNFIEEKIRQTLRKLRDKGLLRFVSRGRYQLINNNDIVVEQNEVVRNKQYIYLVSNDAMPGWVKIGKTDSLEKRMKELYNKSIPLPFKVIKHFETDSLKSSIELEKIIHDLIYKINPNLKKNTNAIKRDFFQLSTKDAINIFNLIEKISLVNIIV